MRRTAAGIAVALAFVSAFDLISCQESGSVLVKGMPPVGPVKSKWRVTVSVDSDACGLAGTLNPISSIVDMVQTGSSLDVLQENCCCAYDTRWTGSLQGSLMTLTSVGTIGRDVSCNLRVEENDVAIMSDNGFTGEASLVISDADAGCGAGFPCQMHGSFQGTRCQGEECALICLQTICPAVRCSIL
jgi:hypothetical protein